MLAHFISKLIGCILKDINISNFRLIYIEHILKSQNVSLIYNVQLYFNAFNMFCVCFAFVQTKKKTHCIFAKISPKLRPWTPIWEHFVHLWMMSVPKHSSLKLKSAKRGLKKQRGRIDAYGLLLHLFFGRFAKKLIPAWP